MDRLTDTITGRQIKGWNDRWAVDRCYNYWVNMINLINLKFASVCGSKIKELIIIKIEHICRHLAESTPCWTESKYWYNIFCHTGHISGTYIQTVYYIYSIPAGYSEASPAGVAVPEPRGPAIVPKGGIRSRVLQVGKHSFTPVTPEIEGFLHEEKTEVYIEGTNRVYTIDKRLYTRRKVYNETSVWVFVFTCRVM